MYKKGKRAGKERIQITSVWGGVLKTDRTVLVDGAESRDGEEQNSDVVKEGINWRRFCMRK